MRRCTSFAVACLAATIGVAALAAGASAAAPEFGRCVARAGGRYANSGCTQVSAGVGKFEWEPGPGPKNGFTDVLKPGTRATLKTEGGGVVTCTGETGGGEIANAKELAGAAFKFTGCESLAAPCESAGATQGEIITNTLSGVIEGVAANGKVVERLQSPGGILAEFECSGAVVQLRGSTVHTLKTNKRLRKATETYTQKKGEEFWTMTLVQTFGEKIEVNTFV
jgi:hypothetical protein